MLTDICYTMTQCSGECSAKEFSCPLDNISENPTKNYSMRQRIHTQNKAKQKANYIKTRHKVSAQKKQKRNNQKKQMLTNVITRRKRDAGFLDQ